MDSFLANCFASVIKFSQRNPKLEIVEMHSGYGLYKKDALELQREFRQKEVASLLHQQTQSECALRQMFKYNIISNHSPLELTLD